MNYANGKIYAIRSEQTPLIYIGSTTQSLEKRFKQHKGYGHTCSSKEMFKYDDAYIYLVENFPCKYRAELEQQEGFYILNNDCVNKRLVNFKNVKTREIYG
jgi:hypothetical protein